MALWAVNSSDTLAGSVLIILLAGLACLSWKWLSYRLDLASVTPPARLRGICSGLINASQVVSFHPISDDMVPSSRRSWVHSMFLAPSLCLACLKLVSSARKSRITTHMLLVIILCLCSASVVCNFTERLETVFGPFPRLTPLSTLLFGAYGFGAQLLVYVIFRGLGIYYQDCRCSKAADDSFHLTFSDLIPLEQIVLGREFAPLEKVEATAAVPAPKLRSGSKQEKPPKALSPEEYQAVLDRCKELEAQQSAPALESISERLDKGKSKCSPTSSSVQEYLNSVDVSGDSSFEFSQDQSSRTLVCDESPSRVQSSGLKKHFGDTDAGFVRGSSTGSVDGSKALVSLATATAVVSELPLRDAVVSKLSGQLETTLHALANLEDQCLDKDLNIAKLTALVNVTRTVDPAHGSESTVCDDSILPSAGGDKEGSVSSGMGAATSRIREQDAMIRELSERLAASQKGSYDQERTIATLKRQIDTVRLEDGVKDRRAQELEARVHVLEAGLDERGTTIQDRGGQLETSPPEQTDPILEPEAGIDSARPTDEDKYRLVEQLEGRLQTLADSYEEEIGRLTSDRAKFEDLVKELKAKLEVSDLQHAREHEVTIECLQSVISQFETKVAQQHALITHFSSLFESCRAELDEVKCELAFAQTTKTVQRVGLEVRIRSLEREVQDWKDRATSKDQEIQVLRKIADRADRACPQRDGGVQHGDESTDIDENAAAQSDADLTKRSFEEWNDLLEDAGLLPEATSKDVWDDDDVEDSDSDDGRLPAAQAEISALNAKLKERDEQVVALIEFREQFGTQLDDLKSTVDRQREKEHFKKSALQAKVSELKAELSFAQVRCSDHAQQIEEGKRRVQNCKEQVKEHSLQIQDKDSTVRGLKAQRVSLLVSKGISDDALSKAKELIQDIQRRNAEQVKDLENQNERLRSRIVTITEQKCASYAELEQVRADLEEAKSEHETQVSELEATITRLTQAVASLERKAAEEAEKTERSYSPIQAKVAERYRMLAEQLSRQLAQVRSSADRGLDIAGSPANVAVPGLRGTPFDPVPILDRCGTPSWIAADIEDGSSIMMHASNLDISEGAILFGPLSTRSGVMSASTPLQPTYQNDETAGPSSKVGRGQRDDTPFAKPPKAKSKRGKYRD